MFGLDIKSLIVGALIAWFVIPFIMGQFAKLTSPKSA